MKLLLLFSFLLVFTRPPAPSATNYYFSSQTGNDNTGNGTQGNPYASITKLNTIVGSLTAGDNVYFERGSTFYGTINTPNAGTTGNPVTFQAYGSGAKPIITGAVHLQSWTETFAGSKLWESPINSGNNLDMVTINGVMTPMGRTPNTGSYFTIQSRTALVDGGTTVLGKTGSITSTNIPAGSQNWTGAEVFMRTNDWVNDRNPVYSHSGNTITYGSNSLLNANVGNKFFMQGHPVTLDQQNEWYYNPSTKILRMFSISTPASLNVYAAQLDRLMNIISTSDITLRNLKFSGADSIVINTTNSARVKVVSCDLEFSGNEGFNAYTGIDMIVDSCTINWMGNTGIVGRYAYLWHIRNNTITNCGNIRGMGQSFNQQRNGVMLEHTDPDSVVIADNVVEHVGYCGIRFVDNRVKVTRNFVNDYCSISTDGGGIYTNGNKNLPTRREISYNVIINSVGDHSMLADPVNGGGPGVYLDDNSGNVDILYNTVVDATRYGVFLHNNKDVVVAYNNIFNGGKYAGVGIVHDNLGEITEMVNIHHNVIYSPAYVPGAFTPEGHLIEFSTNVNDVDASADVDYNVYAKSSGNYFFAGYDGVYHFYTLAQWRTAFNFDNNALLTTVIEDSMRIVYNATKNTVVLPLTNTYNDLAGGNYPGTITLSPWGSKILRKVADGSQGPPAPLEPYTRWYMIEQKGKTYNRKLN